MILALGMRSENEDGIPERYPGSSVVNDPGYRSVTSDRSQFHRMMKSRCANVPNDRHRTSSRKPWIVHRTMNMVISNETNVESSFDRATCSPWDRCRRSFEL